MSAMTVTNSHYLSLQHQLYVFVMEAHTLSLFCESRTESLYTTQWKLISFFRGFVGD